MTAPAPKFAAPNHAKAPPITATVSTSGAASRRGCPQRARSMFRTVSEIRAGNGRSFIAENASASSNEGHARSQRHREALVANAKDFSDFWGHHVDLLEEHRDRAIWYPFFPAASRGNPASGRAPLTPAAIAPPALVRSSRGQASRRPSPPARSPPQAPRAQGVRRTGPARGSERCGRLAATPGDAPVASTPPRRREPGR